MAALQTVTARALLLFALNVVVAHRLFITEFTQHMNTNEGTFMSIARFLGEQWPHTAWYPLWFNGVPLENAYSPAMPLMNAAFAKLTHASPALSFHATAAFFYCLGPVLLFVCAFRLSGQLNPSFAAALLYSLTSPSVLFRVVRTDLGGWFYARRLHTVVNYGEVAHNIALALLPLAVLLAWLAITRRKFYWYALTGALSGVMVLTNAFAAVDLAICFACLAVTLPAGRRLRSLFELAATSAAAYLWISPYLTPTLIRTIRFNSQFIGGDYRYTAATWIALALSMAGAAALWFATRRLTPFERVSLMLAYSFFAIPALAHYLGIFVLPQPERYHLEMELGFCLAAVVLLGRLPPRVLVAVMVLLSVQVYFYTRFARRLIHSIDVTSTVEYKIAKWLDTNLHGQLALVAGGAGLWLNVFTDNPQFGSGHGPFTPNWMIEHAAYAIYSRPEPSVAWLKAFGCQAVVTGNPPFEHPLKYDGTLALLWREEGHSIYAIPQGPPSLAHIVPLDAIVTTPPIHGLDTAQVERFAAALDRPATLAWTTPEQARITGVVRPGEVIAVQVNYDPGWKATAPITRDGIGLMTIHPSCNGPCEVALWFDGGLERRICRWLSALTLVLTCALTLRSLFRRFPPDDPDPLDPAKIEAARKALSELPVPDANARAYLDKHIPRLARTIALIPPPGATGRVLELGCYMQITPLLERLSGYGEVRGAYYGKRGGLEHKTLAFPDGLFQCELDLFDAELDPFPYPDGHFDVVIAGEIIEHFLHDPMHMLLEARRVLVEGGRLVITTPNVGSVTSVAKTLGGRDNPQIYYLYKRPASGEELDIGHMREYTAYELGEAVKAAGFEVETLFTTFIPEFSTHKPLLEFLRRNGYDTRLRGEQTFCSAVKRTQLPTDRFPFFLYDG